MIYLKNYLLISLIRFSTLFNRGITLKKQAFSSQRILNKNFIEGSDFNFVQVGANDGISFDFLYDFVILRNSKGLVIEPILDYFKELANNYKDYINIIPVNLAIHPNLDKVVVYKISESSKHKYPHWVKGIASLDAKHHLKTKIDTADIIKEAVKADSLMNVLNKYLAQREIDYFQIDTEGFDYEVLKQLDFFLIKPQIIKFEHVNLNEEDNIAIAKLLKVHNYFLFNEFGDTIAVDLKKIKLY